MKRLLVNDVMTCLPGTRTFWHDLQEWFGMEFVGGDYATLADVTVPNDSTLIVRNATWFGPLEASKRVKTISLLQDIHEEGQLRSQQDEVIRSSVSVVFNSEFTRSKYSEPMGPTAPTIPLPVDFRLFEPGNAMGLQQALGLPDNCVCWVGASQGAAAQVKGWVTFLQVVRMNPDLSFVGVFKDEAPMYTPPNLRAFVRLTHEELVRVYGACRVGLCTSRVETQHLAGVEMGACGLPLVVPPVGCYYSRTLRFPMVIVPESTPDAYTTAIRSVLAGEKSRLDPQAIREYWQHEFDRDVVRSQWQRLIEEVESG